MAFFLHEDLIFVSSQGCFIHPAHLTHAPSIGVVPTVEIVVPIDILQGASIAIL